MQIYANEHERSAMSEQFFSCLKCIGALGSTHGVETAVPNNVVEIEG